MDERPDPNLVNQMSGSGATAAGSIGVVNNYLNGQPAHSLPRDNLALAGIVPNPRFVGREDELTRLRAALDAGDVNVTQAVRGEGGIGKTELAKAFLFRYQGDFGAVWWVDASPAGFAQSLRGLLIALRIDAPPDAPEEAICGLVRHAWADGRTHLVVLDNIETDHEYRLLRPPAPCRTLLTTRFALEPGHIAEFMLDVLSPVDALALLRARRPDLSTPADEAALAELAEEAGRHAQALALLAASLARYGGTPGDLLARLRAQPVGSEGHPFGEVPRTHAHPDYALSVEASLSLHWDRLSHPAARPLLDLCAFVHPDNIPVPLLAHAASLDERTALIALTELADLSILRRTGNVVSLHRLTQAVVRARNSVEASHRCLASWVETLNAVFSNAQDHRRFPLMQAAEAHAVATIEHGASRGSLPNLGELANGVGVLRWRTGRFAPALIVLREAERIDRVAYGNGSPQVAVDISNAGMVLHALGNLDDALGAFREAERIARAALGNDNHRVATAVNNAGMVLHDRGDLDGALAAYREAERILRAAYGKDTPQVATAVNNAGMVLHDRGDLDGALAAYREAERIFRAVLGDDHPQVATVVNNAGGVLQARSDLDGAVAAFREAERIDRAALGDDHPQVAIRVSNAGSVLQARGDQNGALVAYREAFLILFKTHGLHGQNVLAAAGNVISAGGDPVALVRERFGSEAARELEGALLEGQGRKISQGLQSEEATGSEPALSREAS